VIARLPEATVFMGVPTLYVRMLAEPGAHARGLRAHAAVHQRLGAAADRDLQRLAGPHRPHHPGTLRHERDGDADVSNPYEPASARRGGTVGFPLPGVGVRVRDDKGAPLASGEIGGIQVKGPNVFKGYWRMPEKTADEFTTDLWFKTGDVGRSTRTATSPSSAAART
jgi:malonyl-CoA/methylmalonyl-CoA synthetase